jgi:hypothetical protein
MLSGFTFQDIYTERTCCSKHTATSIRSQGYCHKHTAESILLQACCHKHTDACAVADCFQGEAPSPCTGITIVWLLLMLSVLLRVPGSAEPLLMLLCPAVVAAAGARTDMVLAVLP